ncbi:MAG: sensor histidine kinase [Vicinamibacterales bacterium]
MTSLRRHLVLHLLAGTLLLYVTWAIGFYLYTWHTFNEHFNTALAEKAWTFTDLIEVERDGRRRDDGIRTRVDLEFLGLALPEFQPSPDAMFYQLWTRTGDVIAKSPSLARRDLAPPAPSVTGQPMFVDVELPNGERGRAAVLRFAPRLDDEVSRARGPVPDDELVLMMARNRRTLDDAWAVLVQGFLLFGCLLPVGTAWVVHRAVRRGLNPVSRIASEIGSIGVTSLASRIDAHAMPEEMRPIATRLNDLLGRLETAFQRERRLTSDIAHELRTPIAELRILAEMRLREGSEPQEGDVREDMRDVLGIATQMERLIETLFALARGQSGAVPVHLTEQDLVALVTTAWRPHQAAVDMRDIAVDTALPSSAAVTTDAELFGAVLANLFANAVAYTPAGGRITMTLTRAEQTWRVRLANTCVHLTADDVSHVFEPFWRKDEARSDPARVGLGLSLVKTYSDVLGIDVQCRLEGDDQFVVSVEIPPAAPASTATARGSIAAA